VKVATITSGSGPAIQTGQTASVLYTGYLASNGHIFDDSVNDGGPPFSFTLGSGEVIPGFDLGTTGMQVGETRIVEIPPKQGYGSEVSSSIPANSTLIFVLTLEGISTPSSTTASTTTA
jgi:FKBP-type peptidyl-prolyl cis-trans isomerase